MWQSASHRDVEPQGVEALARVASALRIPVLAIGGVNEERLGMVAASGAAGFAAIGMFR